MGWSVTWQEPVVALIVGLAVVYLYRHLRGMLRIAKPGAQQSCHGCDECADEPATVNPAVGLAERRTR